MANGTINEEEGANISTQLTHKSSSDTCKVLEVPSDVCIVEGCTVTTSDVDVQQSVISERYSETPISLVSMSSPSGSRQNTSSQKGFNIQNLKCCLESCIQKDTGEIDLDRYLDAYREICKLLDNLGTVIRTHIGKDIKLKIDLMMDHKAGSNGVFYQFVEKMVTFEKIKRIHKKNPEENGSRTILILHRCLNFIIDFLRSLNNLKADQGVGSIGRDAYNRTLGPFHPWAYRHIARLALSTLGKKGQLVANFHDGSMSPSQVHEMVEAVVKVATQVYDRCQAVYEKNNFLNLP